MNEKHVVLILAGLIAALSAIGAWSGNVAVLTMAASCITGLFAFLQVHTD
jgi:hypothetical protein